jgi:hypothetical protein
MKAIFLSLMLCFSCTKYASFKKDTVGLQIEPVEMEVYRLEEEEWKVGLKKGDSISQSFTFFVDLPRIQNSDLDYLTKERNIDGWILRIISLKGSGSQDLGSVYALFKPKRVSRGMNSGAPSNIRIKISYAAAFASERFRRFKCPAFGHSKKISSMKIAGDNEPFTINIGQAVSYNEKSLIVGLTPSAFNGGNSLAGNYYIEIAAYDSQKKMILSPFKRLSQYIQVESEDEIRVKSCDGIHPEN